MSSSPVAALLRAQLDTISAFPDIVFAGHPALRVTAAPVSVDEGRTIAARLTDTLRRYRERTGLGVGLAAPQVGITRAVFVTFLDGAWEAYVNPEVVAVSNERSLLRELCLSSGVLWCDVVRPAEVTLRWTDLDGAVQERAFDGRPARGLQHERDHLAGVLNLDVAVPGTIAFVDGDPRLQQLRPA